MNRVASEKLTYEQMYISSSSSDLSVQVSDQSSYHISATQTDFIILQLTTLQES